MSFCVCHKRFSAWTTCSVLLRGKEEGEGHSRRRTCPLPLMKEEDRQSGDLLLRYHHFRLFGSNGYKIPTKMWPGLTGCPAIWFLHQSKICSMGTGLIFHAVIKAAIGTQSPSSACTFPRMRDLGLLGVLKTDSVKLLMVTSTSSTGKRD